MPLVSYRVESDLGANHVGDILTMEPDMAQALVDAGILAEATPEDVNPEMPDEEYGEETPNMEPEHNANMEPERHALTRAINEGFQKLETSLVRSAVKPEKGVSVGNFATPKTLAIKSMGDLCRTQFRAQGGDRTAQNKLHAYQQEIKLKAPVGSQEGTQIAGGYSVIPDWTEELFYKVKNLPRLLDMTRKETISSNTLNIPGINETSLVDGSRGAGILAYWVSEGNVATTSYPNMGQVTAVLNTQVVIVPITNQLLEDNAYNLDAFITERVGEEFTFQEDFAVIQGSGTGQPKGILNQASLVTVPKETSQAAASVVFQNLTKMWARIWPPSRGNSVWLCNPQVLQQLIQMTFPNATGTYPAFGFVNWDAHEEFPLRIFGRPVIECLMAADLGNPGDLILCDLKQLTTAEHPGLQVAVSDQVYFTSLQTLFRFVRRYDIQSPWLTSLTDFNNHYTYSPFVVLGARGT